MKLHSDREILAVSKTLAEKVLELDSQCDKSKLDDVELEHIKDIAAMARMITGDLTEYDPKDDIGLTR